MAKIIVDYAEVTLELSALAECLPEDLARKLFYSLLGFGNGAALYFRVLGSGSESSTGDHVIRFGIGWKRELIAATFGTADRDLIYGHIDSYIRGEEIKAEPYTLDFSDH